MEKEYAWLVDAIRKGKDSGSLDAVLDRVFSQMPEDFVIKPFLKSHQAEVKGMLLTEYNEAETMDLFRKDGIEEGKEIGFANALISLVEQGLLPLGVASSQAKMSEDAFRQLMEERAQDLPA